MLVPMRNPDRIRLAYLVTHPIQYQAPLLRLIAAQDDIDLTVFFQSDLSTRPYHDQGFGRTIEWDIPLLDGYRYEYLPTLGNRDKITPWTPFSYGMNRRLARGAFDALWIHGYSRPSSWAAIAAAQRNSIPVLIRDEAHSISTPRSALRASMKHRFFKFLSAYCSGFMAIGEMNKRYYLENGISEDKIFSMPYCVDNAWFAGRARNAAPQRETLRRELGLTSGRPIILYASKLQSRKRPGDLLSAFEQLITARVSSETPYLLFVGDGELKAELEARARTMANDNVKFLGFRNQTELPALFDLCDVFVLPSQLEPWGLIVNEVMNAARPVIVSDHVGCAPDLVMDGINGYRYPTGDVDALARALALTLQDSKTCASMGKESLRIISRWSFEEDVAGLRAALAALRQAEVTG